MSRNLPCAHFLFAVIILAFFILVGCNSVDIATGDGVAPTTQPASPLPVQENVDQLAVYEGAHVGTYPDYARGPTYRLEFDNETWWHGTGSPHNSALIHRQLPSCILGLDGIDYSPVSRDEIRTIVLAGRTWSVLQQSANYASGSVEYVSLPFGFRVIFSHSPEQTTPDQQVTCIQDAEQVINTFTLAPDARQTVASDPPPKPRVWFKATEDAQGEPVIPDITAESKAWPTYTSARGGYTFRYPAGWQVEEGMEPATMLWPSTEDRSGRIWIYYFGEERAAGLSLIEWAEQYETRREFSTSPTFYTDNLEVKDPLGDSQQVRVAYGGVFPGGEYLISRGNLVLSLTTNSSWVTHPAILRAVANSIEFADDAPTSLADIPWRLTVPAALPTTTPTAP